MTDSQDKKSAAAGEKHQTEKEEPQPKKAKTEKQPTIEESFDKEANDDVDKKPKDNDKGEDDDTKNDDETTTKGDSAVKPGEEEDVPSNILEKGIIYFFIRGRVGIDDPEQVGDIARSYMLLRPIDKDAKLGDGPIGDAGNTRLLALPKKVLPVSGKDRFMVFVEKSDASFKTIKDTFLEGSDYTTKTAGTRHTPAAKPAGEGVYAITTTGRESHLAYMLTLPEKPEDFQTDLGLREKGSFILSTKNPQYSGPAFAQLPEGPDYPKEILDEFRSLRWLPTQPKHLDYVNSQVLLIGESSGLDKAVEPQDKDQKAGKEEPKEVLDHLEEEDLERMRHLPGDQSASLFADLEVHAKDYPKLQTTF